MRPEGSDPTLFNSMIKIYTSSSCPHCVQLKDWLKEEGHSYEEINVTKHPEAGQEMISLTGNITLPTVIINGKPSIGFNPKHISKLLEE